MPPEPISFLEHIIKNRRITSSFTLDDTIEPLLTNNLEVTEDRVRSLHRQIEALKSELKAEETKIFWINKALAPIRRLNRDVLFELFKHYIQLHEHERIIREQDPHPRYARLHERLPPIILLSHICASWREVVHSTPELWSQIRTTTAGRSHELEILSMHLERSGITPLDMVLETAKHGSMRDAFLPLLAESSSRLRSLGLHVSIGDLICLFQCIDFDWPSLTRIDISLSSDHYHYGQSHPEGIWMDLRNAPKLNALTVFVPPEFDPEMEIYDSLYPPSSITTLQLMHGCTHPSSICRIMSLCPLLQKCTIAVPDFPNPLEPEHLGLHNDPITLPYLTHLEIQFCDPFGCPEILDVFEFPALRSLVLFHNNASRRSLRRELFSHLSRFQERSSFNLIWFSVYQITQIDTADIVRFLDRVPSLEDLVISHCKIDIHSFCDWMTVKKEFVIISPALYRMKILDEPYGWHMEGLGSDRDKVVLEMVKSRAVDHDDLGSLRLGGGIGLGGYEKKLREDVWRELQLLGEEGTVPFRMLAHNA
ncbi:hypothetical protein VKT23_019789 [Stygiomarasmius scandens]|uniref:F-box domain-containing protein n=1 Tax=Marasmiellus scandens TaxID=2682957 RepID=A0ABR1IKJ8_9AGAR